jgi:predicted outer membrane protein
MLDTLNSAAPADFDKKYADDMVCGHEKLLDLLQH